VILEPRVNGLGSDSTVSLLCSVPEVQSSSAVALQPHDPARDVYRKLRLYLEDGRQGTVAPAPAATEVLAAGVQGARGIEIQWSDEDRVGKIRVHASARCCRSLRL
jgi:hypothetical protein